MIARSPLPPFVHVALVTLLAVLMLAIVPGCESLPTFDAVRALPAQTVAAAEAATVNALDAVPASAEQLDKAASVLDGVAPFVPQPGGLVVGVAGGLLAFLANLKRRRHQKAAILTGSVFREVVGSVKSYLDGLPPDDRAKAKQALAAKQDAATQAAVVIARSVA